MSRLSPSEIHEQARQLAQGGTWLEKLGGAHQKFYRPASGHHLDNAHHSLVLMVYGMAVIDEFADDRRICERDDHLQ